ncbi:MAG: exostosin family protein [Granulosicoccus sp.]
MKLYLTSAYDIHPGLDTLLDSAALDSHQTHTVCASAEQADAIVLIENTQFDDVLFKHLHEHELLRKWPDKIFMYNEMDRPWDVLPGLYTCMPKKRFNASTQRAFAYLSTPNQYIRDIHLHNPERRWLFSFMGAMSHHCRRRIMRLPTDNACLVDTSGFNVWSASETNRNAAAKEYADVLGASQFILCPRGIGTSSLRLYETLQAGRTPVIISDQWVPPAETDWCFAVRVAEKSIRSLPALLKSLENEATERGQAARVAWLQSYAPETLFNSLGNAIADLQQQRVRLRKHPRAGLSSVPLAWNKWLASAGLVTRITAQRLRRQR